MGDGCQQGEYAGSAGGFPGGFTTFSTGGPSGPTGNRRPRPGVIDVEEVHVERIDDDPSSLPPTTPPE